MSQTVSIDKEVRRTATRVMNLIRRDEKVCDAIDRFCKDRSIYFKKRVLSVCEDIVITKIKDEQEDCRC
jgi:hypothetical protein